MKYIKKNGTEPKTLKEYRQTTPNAIYKGFIDTDQKLKKALLKEQKYICAYCMRAIDLDTVSVEHYISQKKHKDSPYSIEKHKQLSLEYRNMLGVCVNNGEHCDKTRMNTPFRRLNPLKPECEKLLTYSFSGRISAITDNEDVSFDIELLKLNCDFLKNNRLTILEAAKNIFIKEHPRGTWTKKMLKKEAEKYRQPINRKGIAKFKPFCNYIAWYFNELSKNSKYP